MTDSSTVDCPTETPKTFKEIAQNFLDEISYQLEEGNIEPSIVPRIEDIEQMLDDIIEFL